MSIREQIYIDGVIFLVLAMLVMTPHGWILRRKRYSTALAPQPLWNQNRQGITLFSGTVEQMELLTRSWRRQRKYEEGV